LQCHDNTAGTDFFPGAMPRGEKNIWHLTDFRGRAGKNFGVRVFSVQVEKARQGADTARGRRFGQNIVRAQWARA
jgi:hypothetical protein